MIPIKRDRPDSMSTKRMTSESPNWLQDQIGVDEDARTFGRVPVIASIVDDAALPAQFSAAVDTAIGHERLVRPRNLQGAEQITSGRASLNPGTH